MKIFGLLFLIISCSLNSFAASKLLLQASLQTKAHSGFHQYDVVEVREARQMFVNGLKVLPKYVSKLEAPMKELRRLPKTSHQNCTAGTFVYRISLGKGDSTQTAEGCSQGPEYARIFTALSELKSYGKND